MTPCGVDWAAVGSMLQGLGAVVTAGSAVGALIVGGRSFEQWLRQRKAERKLQVGERLLSFAYQAKAAFSAIRSPGQTGFEMSEAEKEIVSQGIKYQPEQLPRLLWSLTTLSRLSDYADLWKELFECRTLARIFFGVELEQAVQAFWEQRSKVRVSALTYWNTEDRAFRERCERDFWEGVGDVPGGPGDAVKRTVDGAFDTIERAVLPLVSDQS